MGGASICLLPGRHAFRAPSGRATWCRAGRPGPWVARCGFLDVALGGVYVAGMAEEVVVTTPSRRIGVQLSVGGVLGFVGWSLGGPAVIAWWYAPPVSAGVIPPSA